MEIATANSSVEPSHLPEAYSPQSLQHFHEPLPSTSEYRWTYLALQTQIRVKFERSKQYKAETRRPPCFILVHEACNASLKDIFLVPRPRT